MIYFSSSLSITSKKIGFWLWVILDFWGRMRFVAPMMWNESRMSVVTAKIKGFISATNNFGVTVDVFYVQHFVFYITFRSCTRIWARLIVNKAAAKLFFFWYLVILAKDSISMKACQVLPWSSPWKTSKTQLKYKWESMCVLRKVQSKIPVYLKSTEHKTWIGNSRIWFPEPTTPPAKILWVKSLNEKAKRKFGLACAWLSIPQRGGHLLLFVLHKLPPPSILLGDGNLCNSSSWV